MGVFKASATGEIKGLDADFEKIKQQFNAALGQAYGYLENGMAACLVEHIGNDVYLAYPEPEVYVRRWRKNGGLLDLDSNLKKGGAADEARIEYDPSGYSPQWENPADGDELIRRIESKNPQYEWKKDMPARPFFQNFVYEMIEGGRAENVLVDGINRADKDLGIVADGDIVRDSSEWDG